MPLSFINEVIAKYENKSEPFELFEVGQALLAAAEDHDLSNEEMHKVRSEAAALRFNTSGIDGSEWGTHFGPWYSEKREDGTWIQDPDLTDLDTISISAWGERANAVHHPILKARFADVIWDIQRKISPLDNRQYAFGQMAADSYLQAASDSQFKWKIQAIFALQRALSISLQLNDAERTVRIVDRMNVMAGAVELDKPGIWAVPFDSAFEKNNVTPEQNSEILSHLENRLKNAVAENDGFRAQFAGERLAKAYRKHGDQENMIRVIRSFGETFYRMAEGVGSLLAIGWLQPIIAIYQRESLTEDAERLRIYIEKRGRNVNEEMHVSKIEITFDRKEVDDHLDRILDTRDPYIALFRLANSLLSDPEEVRQKMRENSELYISERLFPISIVGHHGLPIATIGTIDEDEDGRVIQSIARDMSLMQTFFIHGYDKIKEKFSITTSSILGSILSSPLFRSDRRAFFESGFSAYESGDYLKAIHILVPQIENLLRALLEIMEIPTTKSVNGGTELKNMNDVLNDIRVQSSLEEKWWIFFRTLYIDKRGYNLRNDMAHGIAPLDVFNAGSAALVIQSIILLSVIRPEAVTRKSEEAPAVPVAESHPADRIKG